jgi:uncharacterized protein (DUF1697 family)
MAELRGALEEAGITVRHTYLQTGNVVFDARRAPATELAAHIEAAVRPKLARPTAAVVLSARQLGRVLADGPADWGNDEVTFAHHVVFVVRPVTACQVLAGPAVRRRHGAGQQQGPRHLLVDPQGRSRSQRHGAAGAEAGLPAHHCSHPRTRP